MARYLSADWFEAARTPVPSKAVVLEQVVRDTPDGTVVYRVHAGAGRAAIEWPVPDGAPEPHLRITSDWTTAVAVARGELSTQNALMQGKLRVSGNPTVAVDEVAGADALPPEVRRTTTFDGDRDGG